MQPLVLPPALQVLATQQWGAFSRRQALDAGLSGQELARRLRTGQLEALRRAVYAYGLPDDVLTRHRARAAARWLAVERDVVVSHASAAAVRGWRLLDDPPAEPHLTRPRPVGARPAKPSGVFEAHLPPAHRERLGRVPLTTAPRTLADCCRVLRRDAGVVLADSALSCGASRRDALTVLQQCRGWPGAAAAKDVLRFADPRSESALESLARQWCHEHGLPPPELQARLYRDGRLLGRVDLLWPEHRTVCELDGRVKYDGRDSLFDEKRREDRLRDAGAEVVRGYWSDGADRGAALAGRLRQAFARAALRTDPPRYQVVLMPLAAVA